MLTNDFKSAVQSENLRRVRIMMKDSLLVDRTFAEFDDMARYAAQCGLNIWDTEEGAFSAVSSARSVDTMNRELVNLIECFSKERVMYLKSLIRDIYGAPAPSAQQTPPAQQKSQAPGTQHSGQSIGKQAQRNYAGQGKDSADQILKSIRLYNRHISNIFSNTKRFKKDDILHIQQYSEEMARLCRKLMEGVK